MDTSEAGVRGGERSRRWFREGWRLAAEARGGRRLLKPSRSEASEAGIRGEEVHREIKICRKDILKAGVRGGWRSFKRKGLEKGDRRESQIS